MSTIEPSSNEEFPKNNDIQKDKDTIATYLSGFPPRIVKRCFITGKQCIFSSLICESHSDQPSVAKRDKDLTVFVIMPFKANFETFYQWSLKPYLKSLGIDEVNVRKADEIMDTGYIVCEKICKRIQQSDLIIADISVKNSNVFYELGLSYGLEKPVLLIQKENTVDDFLGDPRIISSLSYGQLPQTIVRKKVFRYQGVEKLNEQQITNYIITPPRTKSPQPVKANKILKISLLDFSSPLYPSSSDSIPVPSTDDIHLDFHQIVMGATNAAMSEISDDISSENESTKSDLDMVYRREWEQIREFFTHKDKSQTKDEFYEVQTINIDGSQPYSSISQQIETSFCTIVDVTPWNEDSYLAYFWLGYCHSRGLNIIPVFKLNNHDKLPESGNKLAFDVRSLWFADFNDKEPYVFKKRLQEILKHLILRDLPDRQKRDFWRRFPPENKLKVFTGAIHIQSLRREVVGDWDVRTVSELFSYLPLIRETAMPTLITPFYSPEQAFKRLQKEKPGLKKDDFTSEFNKGIYNQLKGSNAIIIASPDVNPVAEFFLTKIYQVSSNDQEYVPRIPFLRYDHPEFNGYIMVKRRKPSEVDERKPEGDPETEKFPRLFFIEQVLDEGSNSQQRGFFHHQGTTEGKRYLEEYYSQDDKLPDGEGKRHLDEYDSQDDKLPDDEGKRYLEEYDSQDDKLPDDEGKSVFKLLGHLLVAKYPPEDENSNFIILLNGVSGPATFALAQILTGGGIDASDRDSNSVSEEMLYEINWRLNERPDAIGVQGLVEIEVGLDNHSKDKEKITNVDIRTVKSWRWYPNHPETIFRKRINNSKSK